MRVVGGITVLALLSLATLPASAQIAADEEADRAAIARAIDASIGWFATKDFDLLERTIADDPDYFAFHPDSRTTVLGTQATRAGWAIFRAPDARYLSHEIRDLRIHRHPSGEVAWFSAILDDCGEFSGRKGCWLDTRWTGVLERREGRWVIMQMHFSFAADHVRDRVETRLREELARGAAAAKAAPDSVDPGDAEAMPSS